MKVQLMVTLDVREKAVTRSDVEYLVRTAIIRENERQAYCDKWLEPALPVSVALLPLPVRPNSALTSEHEPK